MKKKLKEQSVDREVKQEKIDAKTAGIRENLKHQKENFEQKVKELRKTDMKKDKERSDALE